MLSSLPQMTLPDVWDGGDVIDLTINVCLSKIQRMRDDDVQ